MRGWNRCLALLIALAICVSGLFQGVAIVSAASYSNGNLQRLAKYVNDYGVDDSNGRGKMLIALKTSGDYDFYFVLRDQTDGLYFNLLVGSDNQDRIVSSTEFVLIESSNYISVDYTMLMYYNNQCVDQAYTTKSINKTTFTSTSTYSVSGSGTYISASDFSDNFHTTLRLLCSYWDEYIYTQLGFGLKAIGFTSYDGYGGAACTSHSYDNSCDATCNNCGATRSVTHTYSGGCDTSCNICGSSRTAGGSHTYDNNKDASCNVCGYVRTVIVEDTSATLYSGICGGQVSWKLTQNGTLVISGTGNMYGYDYDTQPWRDYRDDIKKIQIMPGVTSIGNYAFYWCRKAESVEIAETVTILGKSCFSSCSSLREIIIPYGVKAIPAFAFDGCSNAEYIYVPPTVTSFEQDCFEDCSSISYFIIPDGTTRIPSGMLWGCNNLLYVQIPKSVTVIDGLAFHECGNLADVYYTGSQSQYNAISISNINNYNEGLLNATIHYNSKAPEAPAKNGWVQENGKWCYYENGVKVANCWKMDSAGWCYLGADGYFVTNSWVKDSVGWCYLNSNGRMVYNQWVKDSKGWCYVGGSGYMIYNQWVLSGGKWYFLDSNGYMVTNAWRKDSKGWCWLTASGAMATNQWVKDSKGWCYIGADGYCWTNCWAKDSVGWVWLDKEGSMVYNQWILDGGKWYYVGANGYMLYSTSLRYNSKTYNFNASGVCTNP